MPTGKVKWFNPEKGYGFIIPDEGGRDLFVHLSAVKGMSFGDSLEEGQPVEFNVQETQKGLQAVDVKLTD
jgi:cold shock protein